MLSRATARLVQPLRPVVVATRTSADNASGVRDEVNFPRPVRAIEPGKVRMGFLPDEWFTFFHKKTGVTGPYAFGFGLSTYLLSKEIYVLEHEYYTGLSILVMVIAGVKMFGKQTSEYCQSGVKEIEDGWNEGRKLQSQNLEESIAGEKKAQWCAEGQTLLMAAKRENVLLQLEAAYRERLMNAYQEVKHRLDYQVEKQNIDRRISQKHMVQWIVNGVLKSITPEQEKETLNKCIADLGLLAKA